MNIFIRQTLQNSGKYNKNKKNVNIERRTNTTHRVKSEMLRKKYTEGLK